MQSTVPPRFLAAGGSVCTDARTASKACTGSGIRGPVQDVHDTFLPWFGVRSVPRDSLQPDPPLTPPKIPSASSAPDVPDARKTDKYPGRKLRNRMSRFSPDSGKAFDCDKLPLRVFGFFFSPWVSLYPKTEIPRDAIFTVISDGHPSCDEGRGWLKGMEGDARVASECVCFCSPSPNRHSPPR